MIYWLRMGFDDENGSRTSVWLVRLYLAAAIGIFVVAAFVIYYMFWVTPETNCGIVVYGSPAAAGASVVAERVTHDPNFASKLSDSLTRENGYQVRFFLPAGTYKLTVTGTDGRILHVEPGEFIPPGRRLTLDLRRKLAQTQPSFQP